MTKITYKFTANEDYSIPNNNYGEETMTEVFGDGYTFGEWLIDNGCRYEHDDESDTYYILDEFDERTGEAYLILEVEEV